MSSNRARLCFLTWVEESSVTRDLDLVARLAGSSLCRGLFVSTKIAHAGVVGSGCDDGRMHLPVTVMSSCPVADIPVTSRVSATVQYWADVDSVAAVHGGTRT
jgi:hypothetical protein